MEDGFDGTRAVEERVDEWVGKEKFDQCAAAAVDSDKRKDNDQPSQSPPSNPSALSTHKKV